MRFEKHLLQALLCNDIIKKDKYSLNPLVPGAHENVYS